MTKYFLIALVLLVGGCKEETARLSKPAPELAAVDMQGEPIKLAHWKGQSVYLNFWSTTCGICLAEMPGLEALGKRYQDKVVVVSINIDPDGTPLDKVLEKQGVSFPVIRDSLGMTRERYRVVGTPSAFLIDSDGILRKMFLGRQEPEKLAAAFNDAATGMLR